ncbi:MULTISPECIES: hypothetical protein [Rhizobium/Agrobacterium group]|nr:MULTISPECIES: hypothetical protein [Rhizobium/Agrobacterium group]TCR67846.1 hypothetical protein EV561_1494 [Rhizobium sp. BK376]
MTGYFSILVLIFKTFETLNDRRTQPRAHAGHFEMRIFEKGE